MLVRLIVGFFVFVAGSFAIFFVVLDDMRMVWVCAGICLILIIAELALERPKK